MQTFTKQPSDVLDYTLDFSQWLAPSDTIAAITVTADPGITLSQSSFTNTTITVWLAGGTDGASYKIQVLATTASSPARIKDVDFLLKVKEL